MCNEMLLPLCKSQSINKLAPRPPPVADAVVMATGRHRRRQAGCCVVVVVVVVWNVTSGVNCRGDGRYTVCGRRVNCVSAITSRVDERCAASPCRCPPETLVICSSGAALPGRRRVGNMHSDACTCVYVLVHVYVTHHCQQGRGQDSSLGQD